MAGGPVGAQSGRATGDTMAVGLEQAVAMALDQGEEAALARLHVEVARAKKHEARAALLPQVSGMAGYTWTPMSLFDMDKLEVPDSLRFTPNPMAPLEDRIAYLENRTPAAVGGIMADLFRGFPFGKKNAYVAGMQASQLIYSGGRARGGVAVARHAEQAARFHFREEVADLKLQVRTVYYQALFAEELVAIAEAVVERGRRFLEEERLRFSTGRASELDVLRAEVELENLRPRLVEARNARDLALMNLKRFINLPLKHPIRLTTRLEQPPSYAPDPESGDAAISAVRSGAVRALQEHVEIRERQLRLARSAHLPTIALSTDYSRHLFPEALWDLGKGWMTDWSVGVRVQVPLFQGFRNTAGVRQAEAALQEARLQLRRFEEAEALEVERALGERARAEAEMEARRFTVGQAERVYDLTSMRYGRGLATQLDVFGAQLAVQQARTNLARARADYHISGAVLDKILGLSDVSETGPARGIRPSNPP